MNSEPLTPLEQSAATTGRRYFVTAGVVYDALCQQIDANRGFPAGVGTKAATLRGLPPADKLPVDGQGRVLVNIDQWRITPDDEGMLAPAIAAGHVSELTAAEYASLLPTPVSFL